MPDKPKPSKRSPSKSASARKPVARKTTAKKPAARKPAAAKKTSARKPSAARKTATTRKPATTRKTTARKPSAARRPAAEVRPAAVEDRPAPTEPTPAPPARKRSLAPYIAAIVVVVLLAAGGAILAARHSSNSPSSTPAAAPLPPNYSADGFSVHFPATPQKGSLGLNLAGSNVAIRLYSAHVGNNTFVVEVMDLPGAVPISDPKQSLDEISSAATGPLNAKVLSKSAGTYRGDPVLDLTTQGNLYQRWRFILKGHRLFIVAGETPQGNVVSGYEGFRDSFSTSTPS